MKKEDKPLKIMISHSSMECLEQCTLKWFLKYVEKLKVDVEPGIENTFGSYIHDVCERFNGDTADDLKKLAKERLKSYEVHPDIKHKIPKAIRNFWKFWNDVLKHEDIPESGREKKFFANTYEEHFNMMGIIDLMFKNKNGELIILDWKTNKKPRDASKQLSFYFYLLKMLGEIPDSQTVLKCKIVYLCVDVVDEYVEVPYDIDELDLESAAARLDSFIKKVKKRQRDKEKYPAKPGPLCPWCDYYKAGVCKGKDVLDFP